MRRNSDEQALHIVMPDDHACSWQLAADVLTIILTVWLQYIT